MGKTTLPDLLSTLRVRRKSSPGHKNLLDKIEGVFYFGRVQSLLLRAKINKEITWHNATHSFGTNLIYSDVDILTTSKLLGRTTMKHTQKYVKTAEKMEQSVTNKINIEFIILQ